jgi:hypothetical protein
MALQPVTRESDAISFLNRDHIVLVTINQKEIVITTSVGMKITIPASPAVLAKFMDELANDVDSNFVSLASPVFSLRAGLQENASERNWK